MLNPFALYRRIKELDEEVASLRRQVRAGRHIDLVDFGSIRVFMYTDDMAYLQTAGKFRNGVLKDRGPVPVENRTPDEVLSGPGSSALDLLMAHYWLHHLDFTYFDVGAQYGASSVSAARLIESCGKDNRVVAFEPGVAAELAAFNIAINYQDKRITFERLAVGADNFPALLFAEAGHSENNRIVNRSPATESMSVLVACTSIDEYVERHGIAGGLILKIDTQGGECEVVQGMRRVMEQRLTTFITEFTPWALETRVNPSEWLHGLMRDNLVLDINIHNSVASEAGRRITGDRVADFVRMVSQSEYKYTDVAVIPKRLPGAEDLISRLERQ